VGAFPVWRPNLDELDVDSAPASAFLIPKSFKIIPSQLVCRVPARVLACLLSDGPDAVVRRLYFMRALLNNTFVLQHHTFLIFYLFGAVRLHGLFLPFFYYPGVYIVYVLVNFMRGTEL
jgi:hypothetical protein